MSLSKAVQRQVIIGWNYFWSSIVQQGLQLLVFQKKNVYSYLSKKRTCRLKGGFFSKSAMCFLDLQISKKIFQKTILSLKFKFPANNSKLLLAGNLNFRLRIVYWNIFFFWDLEVWKMNRTFWKKATFMPCPSIGPK